MKIKCYDNLGRIGESRESVLLYLLMSDETDDRSYAIDLFTDMEFSDILNILVLKESDGIKAQMLKYISYTNIGEYEKAKSLIIDFLASELTIEQFASLIVLHPFDNDYTYSFFDAWYKTISESEKSSFFSLFFYFTRQLNSENVMKSCLSLLNSFDTDSFFINSDINKAILYKIKGLLCDKLHDTFNSRIYFIESYKLNPKDDEIINLVK